MIRSPESLQIANYANPVVNIGFRLVRDASDVICRTIWQHQAFLVPKCLQGIIMQAAHALISLVY